MILPYAGLPVLALLLADCAPMPGRAATDRSEVIRAAESAARMLQIDLSGYNREEVRYVAPYQFWYVAYAERGYLLAAGDEFTVLVDDARGNCELLRDTGVRGASSKLKLEAAKERWTRERFRQSASSSAHPEKAH
ncbi:hypothetical protein [Haloferula sp. BvORR071]|uniref:hypothetical protein n=1 Tax=Haloferula sp. BvORR071 TaxID=1396141 RepID=UPI002240FAC5|nr:hypothetical protein [Haloferula sp. BvORR071]